MPLVSICLPNLNTRPFLEPRMESIMAQTLSDWELIVVDNYSDDGAWEFLQSYRDDPRVKLSQAAREGIYANWNNCLREARGDYVYIATSDDTMRPDCLARMVGALDVGRETWDVGRETWDVGRRTGRGGRGVDLCVCGLDFIDEAGVVIPDAKPKPMRVLDPWDTVPHVRSGLVDFLITACLGIPWISITSICFRRRLLDVTGPFETQCGVLGDLIWALKATLSSDVVYIPEPLGTWRMHGGQQSHTIQVDLLGKAWALVESLLTAHADRIPEAWKADSEWREKLTLGVRSRYYRAFNLDRMALRRYPWRVMQGLAMALRREPGFAWRRLAQGLSWQAPQYFDDHAYVKQLIADWHVPWPPVPLGEHAPSRMERGADDGG